MLRSCCAVHILLAMFVAGASAWPGLGFAQPASGPIPAQAEIQIGLCGEPDGIERALTLRPRGRALDVWLFDDARLTLFDRGLRVRLRQSAKAAELTLKVADQDCRRLDPALIPAGEGKCEYDLHGDRLAGAVSLTRRLGHGAAKDLVAGRLPLADALGPGQVRYLRSVAGAWPLPPGIAALGPIGVRTFRSAGSAYDVDESTLPDGERFIEISRKVATAEVPAAKAALESDLARAGATACADQSAQAVNKLRALLPRS